MTLVVRGTGVAKKIDDGNPAGGQIVCQISLRIIRRDGNTNEVTANRNGFRNGIALRRDDGNVAAVAIQHIRLQPI